ncbi:MAG: hypothetical protein U1A72_00745, partial [Sulfuritalea sp.]|nr:hypothetical protein [Sulfuritalea sp.]
GRLTRQQSEKRRGYGYVDSSPDGDLPTYPQPRQTPDLFYLVFNVKTDRSDSNLDWNGLP